MLSVPLSPEVADRRALKAGIYQKSDTVRKESCNHSPADVREPCRNRFGKYPEVEKDDGNLRKHNDNLIDVLIDVEVLEPSVRCQKAG